MRPPVKSLTQFQVDVRDLPTRRVIAIEPSFVADAVAGMPLREALGDDRSVADGGEAELELYSDESTDTTVFVHGAIRGTVAIACCRCVTPVAVTFDERVRVTFVPAPPTAADDDATPGAKGAADDEDGVELSADELDVFPYDGEIVDLAPLVREQFVLAVPFAPLCKDDCAGLCPQCGVDRNLSTCACTRPADPRFAALAGLKLPS